MGGISEISFSFSLSLDLEFNPELASRGPKIVPHVRDGGVELSNFSPEHGQDGVGRGKYLLSHPGTLESRRPRTSTKKNLIVYIP